MLHFLWVLFRSYLSSIRAWEMLLASQKLWKRLRLDCWVMDVFKIPKLSPLLIVQPPTFANIAAIMAGALPTAAWLRTPAQDLCKTQNSALESGCSGPSGAWGRRRTDVSPPAFSRLVTVGAGGLHDANLEIVEHFKQSILLPSLPGPG